MPDPNNTPKSSKQQDPEHDGSIKPGLSERGIGNPEKAAPEAGPPVATTKTTGSGQSTDSPAEALGRRILSTAFVRVGPDGHLTVELRDGRVVVLRHMVMGPKDYCGVQVAGDPARTKYCGGYAEVAAARPGGGPDHAGFVDPNTVEPSRNPAKAN